MTGPTTRRGLIGAALAGVAVGGVAPFLTPEHPDATLLVLRAEFEALQRKINGAFGWRVDGQVRATVNYIIDDDERDAALVPVEEEIWRIHMQIFDLRASTFDELRAKVRCLLLVDGEMRDPVAGDEDAVDNFGLYRVTSDLLTTVLQDLSDGSISDATCADVALTEVRL